MILVTGTKRSGTSLWMQILIAAGLPHLGEAFPAVWGESIRDQNPRGFYESRFRQGVFYATNPDRRTGAFLDPRSTREHAVKVFVPGLTRTDLAYVHRVVATMRRWRSYCASLSRLYAREDAWLAEHPPAGRTPDEALRVARARRGSRPLPVEWFMENYELLRDFSTRRYPINLSTYERLMAEPEVLVPRVLGWLGRGNAEAALGAVDPALNHASEPDGVDDAGLPRATLQLLDDLHEAIHVRQAVPRSLLGDLNATWEQLQATWGRLSRERGREDDATPEEAPV